MRICLPKRNIRSGIEGEGTVALTRIRLRCARECWAAPCRVRRASPTPRSVPTTGRSTRRVRTGCAAAPAAFRRGRSALEPVPSRCTPSATSIRCGDAEVACRLCPARETVGYDRRPSPGNKGTESNDTPTELMLAINSVERGTALFKTWYVRNLSCCERLKLWTIPPVRSCRALVVKPVCRCSYVPYNLHVQPAEDS